MDETFTLSRGEASWIAAPPPPDGPGARARVHLRYEDVCQDGRLLLELMPNALGAAVWGAQIAKDPFVQGCFAAGIVPILTRFVIEGMPGPFSVMTPLSVTGRFALGRTDSDRVMLNMWAELEGPIARTYPPQPANAGTVAPAGRIYGEHVFTRLFAPPGERRVTHRDIPNAPEALPTQAPRAFASLVEGEFTPDDAATVFGLVHTDSNHHVNSLVYLRIFEEAALRHLALGPRARHGASNLLARRIEIAYRKPCFAGDRMRLHVRVLERAAVVAIAPEGAPTSTAHAAARLVFE